MQQRRVEEGGWVKIDTLKDFGIGVNQAAAMALGKGQGAGRGIRFETKMVTDRGRKRTKIRIARKTTYLTPGDQGSLNEARFHVLTTRTMTWRRRSYETIEYKKESWDQPEENSERSEEWERVEEVKRIGPQPP